MSATSCPSLRASSSAASPSVATPAWASTRRRLRLRLSSLGGSSKQHRVRHTPSGLFPHILTLSSRRSGQSVAIGHHHTRNGRQLRRGESIYRVVGTVSQYGILLEASFCLFYWCVVGMSHVPCAPMKPALMDRSGCCRCRFLHQGHAR